MKRLCLAALLAVAPCSWQIWATEEAATPKPATAAMIVDDAAIIEAIIKASETLIKDDAVPNATTFAAQLKRKRTDKVLCEPAIPVDSPKQLYDRCGQSVLVVAHVGLCGDCDDLHVTPATGFVVSADGVAATNYHVMDGLPDGIMVAMTRDMKIFPITAVLAADKASDCALIQLGDGTRKDFTPVPLAPSATIGESVTIISHPDESFFVLTRGVAARYAYTPDTGKVPWLNVTAEYAKGSSGAPVFNDKGQVVGMVESTRSVYYTETRKRQKDLQMVMRHCVPSSAIIRLAAPFVSK